MAEVTVYGSPLSTYVRTVRMVLAEKNVPYDLVDGWADHPEIATRQPFGTLMPEGGPLLESRPGLRNWLSAVGDRRSAKETVPPL